MRFIYTKTFFSFFFTLAFVAFLSFLGAKGWLSPLRTLALQLPRPVVSFVRAGTTPARGFFYSIYNLQRIAGENRQLSARVFSLEQQLVSFDQLKRENEALRSELNFKQNTAQKYQSCSVLSLNPLGLTGTMVLNCGSSDGITEGSAVVSQGYLVGKIVYVSSDSSTALLATDSKFSADARISKNGVSGIARGSFGSGLMLDQLSQDSAADKGALVVTAGISEKIPKNILIGQIGDVISGPNDLFKKTTLSSPVSFGNLQFVFVAR